VTKRPSKTSVDAVIEAHRALRDEVEPLKLFDAANRIRMIMPKLADRLDIKTGRAIGIRLMLALARRGELDPAP
jgi:hypothetical protein